MATQFPNDAQQIARFLRIETLIKNGHLQQAAQALNQLQEKHAHDPRTYLLGSYLAQAANNPVAALKSARRAQQLAPNWPVLTLYLAELLSRSDNPAQALALAAQAVDQATTESGQSKVELLRKAANVALQINAYKHAQQWLQDAMQFDPQDVNVRHDLARVLIQFNQLDAGLVLLDGLLLEQPQNQALLLNRCRACLTAQQLERAKVDAQTLLLQEPANPLYAFYLDLAEGNTPKAQPAGLIQELFDAHALDYDQLYVVQLKYTLPRIVAQLIRQWYPEDDADVLDLGCGTGLLGVAMGPTKGVLVGVDLSAKMIAQALRHRVYDKFHHVNLLDALRETPALQYHVITALDVFGYIGDLTDVVDGALRILLPGGHFVFSSEASAPDTPTDYRLPSNMRYTHQRAYLKRLLKDAGFKNIEIQDLVLRQEAGQPVAGYLISASKPIPTTKRAAPRKRVVKSDAASGA